MALLIIGLSGSWHDQKALGLDHLRVVQDAVYQHKLVDDKFAGIYDFFLKSLVYWEMVASAVDADVLDHASSPQREAFRQQMFRPQKPAFFGRRATPHPWTGLACVPQMIMGQVLSNIHVVRSIKRRTSFCRADLTRLEEVAAETANLEAVLWEFQLPGPAEVDDMGDPETPAIHHIQTAEVFILACLYQIYLVFPDILLNRKDTLRAQWLDAPSFDSPNFLAKHCASLAMDGPVDGFGREAIQRLQVIPMTSGTQYVHGLPLLVCAGALKLPTGHSSPMHQRQQLSQITEMRKWVINRVQDANQQLPYVQMRCYQMFFEHLFKDLDEGNDIFWMDILELLDIKTIFA
ncbi:hypothetical protein ACHAP7_009538 [Fusarium lateritium]